MTAQQINILSQAVKLAADYSKLLFAAKQLSRQVDALGGAAAFAGLTYPRPNSEIDHLDSATKVLLAFAAFNALDAYSDSPLRDAENNVIAATVLEPILKVIR